MDPVNMEMRDKKKLADYIPNVVELIVFTIIPT